MHQFISRSLFSWTRPFPWCILSQGLLSLQCSVSLRYSGNHIHVSFMPSEVPLCVPPLGFSKMDFILPTSAKEAMTVTVRKKRTFMWKIIPACERYSLLNVLQVLLSHRQGHQFRFEKSRRLVHCSNLLGLLSNCTTVTIERSRLQLRT